MRVWFVLRVREAGWMVIKNPSCVSVWTSKTAETRSSGSSLKLVNFQGKIEEKGVTEDEMVGWHHQLNGHAAKSPQSCPTLCNPIDGSPPGSPVPGILQARTLQWVAVSFSSAWKWKVKVKWPSHVRLLATPWTGAYQAPPSMGFSRQEYWSGLPLPSPAWSSICKVND